ncbi:hypothetical protein F5H01DRAFT_349749 [Linnemannia elongata]|nr:hypothetical protein F5H01DRAFT_349749 [Linnemannia elongata]
MIRWSMMIWLVTMTAIAMMRMRMVTARACALLMMPPTPTPTHPTSMSLPMSLPIPTMRKRRIKSLFCRTSEKVQERPGPKLLELSRMAQPPWPRKTVHRLAIVPKSVRGLTNWRKGSQPCSFIALAFTFTLSARSTTLLLVP